MFGLLEFRLGKEGVYVCGGVVVCYGVGVEWGEEGVRIGVEIGN